MRLGGKSSAGVDADRLVSSVLGALRYLPPRLWVAPLLSELRRWNPELHGGLSADGAPEISLWPQHIVPAELVRHLGRLPRDRGGHTILNGSAAPDAVAVCDEWTLVFSVEGDDTTNSERVFQDYVMARLLRPDGRFALVHVNAAGTRRLRAGVQFRVASPERADVQPEDELASYLLARAQRIDTLELKETSVTQHLAWLNWQALHRLLSRSSLTDDPDYQNAPAPYQAMARRIRADAIATLAAADLVAPSYGAVELLAELEISVDALPLWAEHTPPAAGSRESKAAPRTASEPPKNEVAPAKKEAGSPKKAAEAERKSAEPTKPAEPTRPAAQQTQPKAGPKAAEPKVVEAAVATAPVEAEPEGEARPEAAPRQPSEAATAGKAEAEPVSRLAEQGEPAPSAESAPASEAAADRDETGENALLADLAGLVIEPDRIPEFPRPTS